MLGELGLISTQFGTAGAERLVPDQDAVGRFMVFFQLTVNYGYTYLTKAIRKSTRPDTTGAVPADVEVFRSRHVQREFWRGKLWAERNNGSYYWYDTSLGAWTSPFELYCDAFRKPANWGTTSATVMPSTPSTVPTDRYAPDSSIIIQPEMIFFFVDLKDGQSLTLNTTCYREDPFLAGSSPTLSDTIPTATDASPSEAQYTALDFSFLGTMKAWMIRV